ncbi:MAG: hypothetical protein ACM3ZT_08145 [Bacillota bacterium]
MHTRQLTALFLSALAMTACSKAYVAPNSGPRAKLTIITQETRGSVGYMTPEECRKRLGAHTIFELDAKQQVLDTYLPADQDAVLAYDYDQPEHLGPVGPLAHCHVAFAFHPQADGSYMLEVSGVERCTLNVRDAAGQSVPGVAFAADRCNTLPPGLMPLNMQPPTP